MIAGGRGIKYFGCFAVFYEERFFRLGIRRLTRFTIAFTGMVISPQHCSGSSPRCPAKVSEDESFAIIQPTDLHRVTLRLPRKSSIRDQPSPLRESSHSTKTSSPFAVVTFTQTFYACPQCGCSNSALIAFAGSHLFSSKTGNFSGCSYALDFQNSSPFASVALPSNVQN